MLRGEEYLLLSQRTGIWFPTPTSSGGSHLSVTPAPEDPTPSFALHGHLHTYAQIHTQTYLYTLCYSEIIVSK